MINVLIDIMKYARNYPTEEICGVVILENSVEVFVPCRNAIATLAAHLQVSDNFYISPEDYMAAEDRGTVTHIVHSHPFSSPDPSIEDEVGIEETGLPWIIVNPNTGQWTETYPTGKIPPLEGRVFRMGYQDCYSIVRDFHKIMYNIPLPYVVRTSDLTQEGKSIYLREYEKAGFLPIEKSSLEAGDIILMSIRSEGVPNHAAVYTGGGIMLHHLSGRLSCKEPYEGIYKEATFGYYRHKDKPRNA